MSPDAFEHSKRVAIQRRMTNFQKYRKILHYVLPNGKMEHAIVHCCHYSFVYYKNSQNSRDDLQGDSYTIPFHFVYILLLNVLSHDTFLIIGDPNELAL